MPSKGFRERFLEVFEDGSALANSTGQTSLLPASAKSAALPIGFALPGRILQFDFSGRISTVVTTPGTLALALRAGSVDIFASLGIPLNVTAQTNIHWRMWGELVCRAVGTGTSTTWIAKGVAFQSRAVVGSSAAGSGGVGTELLPYNAAPAVGSGYDNSASQLLDLLATWSVANASNSIQLHAGSIDGYTQ